MWLVGIALAAVPPAERLVATGRVAMGLAADGSGGNPAAGVGLLGDPDGPEGPTPPGGDWILGGTGYTFEGWALDWDGGATAAFAAYGVPGPALTWSPVRSGDFERIEAVAEGAAFDLSLTVATPWETPVVWLDLGLTAHEDLDGLAFARVYDPDPDLWLTGSYTAQLRLEEEVAVAASPTDGRALALAGRDGAAGRCGWCTTVDGLTTGDWTGTEDAQVGVRVDVGALAAGETARIRLAYAFGADADEALTRAREAAASDDVDGDGVDDADDCDPWDGAVAPGLPERADGVDNDCDGVVDEDLPSPADPVDTGWGPALVDPVRGSYEQSADCAVAPATAAPGLVLVAAALATRRRRR